MTFTTLTFVLFLPVVFAAYWSTRSNRGRNAVVLAASYRIRTSQMIADLTAHLTLAP